MHYILDEIIYSNSKLYNNSYLLSLYDHGSGY